jgi:hypothetical protein
MGFQTIVSISNDFWHKIAKDPQKLVDAISVGMNSGAGELGPIAQAFDEAPDAPEYRKADAWRNRYRTAPQGVTVHKAEHYDTPQIICNPYGYHAIAAHEIVTAIENGWLDGGKYREQQAEEVAKLLHAEAARIRKAIRNKKAGKNVYA